jgi:hypothetical protein
MGPLRRSLGWRFAILPPLGSIYWAEEVPPRLYRTVDGFGEGSVGVLAKTNPCSDVQSLRALSPGGSVQFAVFVPLEKGLTDASVNYRGIELDMPFRGCGGVGFSQTIEIPLEKIWHDGAMKR